MRTHLHVIFLGAAWLSMSPSHAEGGCPPGQYPQQGQGWQTCVPIPGDGGATSSQTAARRPPRWLARWGALASGGEGQFGISANQPSSADAEAVALNDCRGRGGTDCKLNHTYGNTCMAVIGRPNASVKTVHGPSENDAIESGKETCKRDGVDGCWVYYSGCSLPVQTP